MLSFHNFFFFSDVLYKQSELGGLNRASQQPYHHPEKPWWDVIAVTVLKQGGLPHNHIIFHKTCLPLPGTLPWRRLRGRDMRKMPDQTAPITRFPRWITSAARPRSSQSRRAGTLTLELCSLRSETVSDTPVWNSLVVCKLQRMSGPEVSLYM